MDYITFYSNVENTDWGVRITENLSAQKETAKSYWRLIFLTVVFLAAGILVVQSLITKKLLSPIEKIMQTFADIKRTQDYCHGKRKYLRFFGNNKAGGHGNVSGKRGRKKHLLYYGTIKEKYFEKRRFKIYACKT